MTPTADTDANFTRRLDAARTRDAAALRWLWDRYAGPIRGFLLARGTPDADEVVNDTFLGAFRALDSFAGDEQDFRAWLHRIARNKRVDSLRRRSRRTGTETDLVGVDPAGGDAEADAIRAISTETLPPELHRLLHELTPDQRDVVVLRFVSDLSLEQTAEAVDKPLGAVKALQHRAIARLRRKISVHPYPDERSETMS